MKREFDLYNLSESPTLSYKADRTPIFWFPSSKKKYNPCSHFTDDLSNDFDVKYLKFTTHLKGEEDPKRSISKIASSDFFIDTPLTTWHSYPEIFRTSLKKTNLSDEEKISKKMPVFLELLRNSSQNYIDEWFDEYFHENEYEAKQLLQKAFYTLLTSTDLEESTMVNLLKILLNYEFEEIRPIGPIILTSALTIKSDKVKSTVLDIFGHWPNRETYNILTKLDPPAGILYRIKFESLLKSFQKKYALLKKD